ncbi:MAG: hypothetical protein K2P99_03905, partial [Burkholderiales bacterium]|nr:hypothetical protein [Burkholderiales bacterium]
KGHPYTTWCNSSAGYYEPGKGSNWSSAWKIYVSNGKKHTSSVYKVYPDGIGNYIAGQVVMDSNNGKLYSCLHLSWCNSKTYQLNSSAWVPFEAATPPTGYEVYSPEAAASGAYKAGSIVAGRTDGKLYECKGHPYTAWCNGSAGYYEPGKGSNWASAWIKKT